MWWLRWQKHGLRSEREVFAIVSVSRCVDALYNRAFSPREELTHDLSARARTAFIGVVEYTQHKAVRIQISARRSLIGILQFALQDQKFSLRSSPYFLHYLTRRHGCTSSLGLFASPSPLPGAGLLRRVLCATLESASAKYQTAAQLSTKDAYVSGRR